MSKIDGGLRSLFHKNIKNCIWTAVETGSTSLGVPDSNFLFDDGAEGWVEYKQTKTNRIARNDSWDYQIGWHLRRARAGGRSFIAVRQRLASQRCTSPASDNLWIVPGGLVRVLDILGLDYVRAEAAVFGGGPGGWDWGGVTRFLKH